MLHVTLIAQEPLSDHVTCNTKTDTVLLFKFFLAPLNEDWREKIRATERARINERFKALLARATLDCNISGAGG